MVWQNIETLMGTQAVTLNVNPAVQISIDSFLQKKPHKRNKISSLPAVFVCWFFVVCLLVVGWLVAGCLLVVFW
jgi:hypothetical protein